MPPLRQTTEFARFLKEILENRCPFLLNQMRNLRKRSKYHWRFHSPPEAFSFKAGYTVGESVDDTDLIDRLVKSYLLRLDEFPTDQWLEILEKYHLDIHAAIVEHDELRIEEILRNPLSSDLFYGFDSLSKSLRIGGRRIEDKYGPARTFDGFLRLSEAMAIRRMDYPENYTYTIPKVHIDD